MEERISAIKRLELKKEEVQSIIMLDSPLSANDLKFLEDEFDLFKEDISGFAAKYKSRGIIFRLTPLRKELLKEWKPFLQKALKRQGMKSFDNIFVNNAYDKLLLVTSKRLLNIELERLNEKIDEINQRIESYNEKVKVEMDELAEATKERKGIISKIVGALKR